jgi:catechol 2,3-dioxygenase-like lactoylglutathione lyase family enzyme
MARLVGINHIAIEVGDVDEAVGFFERVFEGVKLRGRSSGMAFVDMGDQFLALAQGVSHAQAHERNIGLHGRGLWLGKQEIRRHGNRRLSKRRCSTPANILQSVVVVNASNAGPRRSRIQRFTRRNRTLHT